MEILLLTQAECSFCDQAKLIIGDLAPEFGLRISAIDLDTPEGRQLGADSGMLFPPGLFLDGQLVFHGRISKRRLRRELERRGRARPEEAG